MAAKNKSNEINIIRVYDASVKDVWEAWTDPKKVEKWWGPRGFTITTHAKDLRPGGSWEYTMHGPDGTEYLNKTKYLEVEKYQRLVYDHGGHEDQNRLPLFRVTVLFRESDGQTTMNMTMALSTPEAAEETRKLIKNAGGNSTWDRLAEFLVKESTQQEKFFISRTFNVSIDVMYAMWTDPKHFSRWLPPTGMEMEFITAEIKPGGNTFYFMSNGQAKMFGKANYLEVNKPHRLVYTQQFTDKDGNPSRHPMSPTWPETMLTTVTLTEEGPDLTRVTVMWESYGNVTPEELETFIKARAGMTQGWTGSFDKLENYLKENGPDDLH